MLCGSCKRALSPRLFSTVGWYARPEVRDDGRRACAEGRKYFSEKKCRGRIIAEVGTQASVMKMLGIIKVRDT